MVVGGVAVIKRMVVADCMYRDREGVEEERVTELFLFSFFFFNFIYLLFYK